MMDYRTAGTTQEQLPASCQQPRPATLDILRRYGRVAREKLSKVFSWTFRPVQDKASHQVPVVGSTSHLNQPGPSADPPRTATQLPTPYVSQRPPLTSSIQKLFTPPEHRMLGSAAETPFGGFHCKDSSQMDQMTRRRSSDTPVVNSDHDKPGQPTSLIQRPTFGVDIDAGFSILLKFRGDGPRQTQPAVASLETRFLKINLMHSEVWDMLSENGRRGSLEPAGNIYVNPTGSATIPVRGVARNVEWYLKNGFRTYTSDFYIMVDDRFDVLIGSDAIRQYRLLEVAALV